MLHIEGFDEVVNSDFPDETDSRQSFDERWAFELDVLFMGVYVGHMWIDHAEEYKSLSVGGDRIKSVCLVPSHRVSMRPSYGSTQGRTYRFCLCPAPPVSGAVR